MPRYETLMLAIPHVTSDEASELEKAYEGVVKKHKGSMITFDRWGKYRLAYPVSKNDYGIYYLARVELNEEGTQDVFNEIRNVLNLKFGNIIMRFVNTKLKDDQSLDYQRPESLEDTPTRDVGQFLRENKMEGLLPSVEGKDKKSAAPAPASQEVEFEENIDG
jgi:small subunit ribosomal protein S6